MRQAGYGARPVRPARRPRSARGTAGPEGLPLKKAATPWHPFAESRPEWTRVRSVKHLELQGPSRWASRRCCPQAAHLRPLRPHRPTAARADGQSSAGRSSRTCAMQSYASVMVTIRAASAIARLITRTALRSSWSARLYRPQHLRAPARARQRHVCHLGD